MMDDNLKQTHKLKLAVAVFNTIINSSNIWSLIVFLRETMQYICSESACYPNLNRKLKKFFFFLNFLFKFG